MPQAAYARRIERCWAERLGQPVVLSPRDWRLIVRWHERGIPLAIVEEAMAAAVERAAAKGRVLRPALSRLAPAIEEGWAAVVGGRVGADKPPVAASAEAVWRARAAVESRDSGLGRLLTELLERLAAGAAREALDADLEARLPGIADPLLLAEIEREIERDLAPHRGRMASAQLAVARRRGRAARLRLRLGLPRLAGPADAR